MHGGGSLSAEITDECGPELQDRRREKLKHRNVEMSCLWRSTNKISARVFCFSFFFFSSQQDEIGAYFVGML